MNNFFHCTLSILTVLLLLASCKTTTNEIGKYHVSWTSPSKMKSDALPIGNGTSGALVSVLEDGKIWVSLRHVDAWSEAHRLLKLGDIEVSISPNPFTNSFQQTLDIQKGVIYLEGDNNFQSRIWIDANNPVVHLENESAHGFTIDVKLHNWRDKPKIDSDENFRGVEGGMEESADEIVQNDQNAIIWFHRNSHTRAFDIAVKALEIPMPENLDNVLENRTFGAWVSGEGFSTQDKTALTSGTAKTQHLKIFTLVNQSASIEDWQSELAERAKQEIDHSRDWQKHVSWWDDFWNRSYIHLSGSEEAVKTSAGYAHAMYLNALAGRGEFPIIWNGSIFSPASTEIPIHNHTGKRQMDDPDYRAWGNLMLHQNVRLPFYSMLASGQFTWTKSFIDMYMRGLPMMKEHTKAVFGHDGTVIRESTTLWGIVAPGVYGIDRTGLEPGQQVNAWHRTHWQSGLELAFFMSEYFDYTQSKTFARDTLVPFANEIVKFFDLHWEHKNGKLYFPDVFAMETFRHTDNPMPLVAGLKSVLQRLLNLPESLTTEADREYWEEVLARVPEIPTRERDGKTILANAEKVYSPKVNVEVSELYAVFPYHLYGVGLPDLEMAQETYRNRTILVDDVGGKNPNWSVGYLRGGWRQEPVMAAMLGMTDSAKNEVSWGLTRMVDGLRYPGFFQTTYDGIPDAQHTSMASTALQRMIIQDVGEKIILLPAFPDDWECDFKLFAKKNTVVEGKIVKGKITRLHVTPEEREKDIYINNTQ